MEISDHSDRSGQNRWNRTEFYLGDCSDRVLSKIIFSDPRNPSDRKLNLSDYISHHSVSSVFAKVTYLAGQSRVFINVISKMALEQSGSSELYFTEQLQEFDNMFIKDYRRKCKKMSWW